MAHKLISKAEAKTLGLKTYFTGKRCPNGHIDVIFVNGRCRTCTLESTAAIRKRNKAKGGKKLQKVITGLPALEPVMPVVGGLALLLCRQDYCRLANSGIEHHRNRQDADPGQARRT